MPKSLRAHFLMAVKGLRDPHFFKSVVLMVEDGENGSMGLILNQPSKTSVQDALADHFDLPGIGDLVYTGGPVEPSALFILHNAGDVDDNEQPLLPGLYVGSTANAFQDVVQRIADGDKDIKFRIYRGCAGWAPYQLQGELARGDWLTVPATAEHVLHDNPYDLWEQLVEIAGRQSGVVPASNGNPELN